MCCPAAMGKRAAIDACLVTSKDTEMNGHQRLSRVGVNGIKRICGNKKDDRMCTFCALVESHAKAKTVTEARQASVRLLAQTVGRYSNLWPAAESRRSFDNAECRFCSSLRRLSFSFSAPPSIKLLCNRGRTLHTSKRGTCMELA